MIGWGGQNDHRGAISFIILNPKQHWKHKLIISLWLVSIPFNSGVLDFCNINQTSFSEVIFDVDTA